MSYPPHEFEHGPIGPPKITEFILEPTDAPGPATALMEKVDELAERWPDYANRIGEIQFNTFTGETVTIRREELYRNRLGPKTVAIGGLTGYMRRRRGATTDSDQYTIRLAYPGETIELNTVKLTRGAGSVQLSGKRTFATPEGPATTTLHTGIDLEDAAQRAMNALENGFPMEEESAIAARQQGPCESIVGNEAAAVQRIAETFFANSHDGQLGDKHAPQQVFLFGKTQPELDGQWSVEGVTTIFRAGTVIPNIPGAKGRSILCDIHFSGQTVNVIDETPLESPLVVHLEGVYEPGSNRLVASRITYYTYDERGNRTPIAASPSARQEIHRAIANQVVPQKFIQLP